MADNFNLGSILGSDAPYGVDDDELQKLKRSPLNNISGINVDENSIPLSVNLTRQPSSVPSSVPTVQQSTPEIEDDDEEEEKSQSSPAATLSKYNNLKANPTQNPPRVSDVLSKLLGSSKQEMTDAQQQRNQLQLIAMLGRAGSTIGGALTPLANVKPDDTAFNALMQQGNQHVTDVQGQHAMQNDALKQLDLQQKLQTEVQKNDPTSPISEQYRNFAKVQDPNISAADLEKLEPQINRQFIAEQNRLTRQDALNNKKSEKQDKAYSDLRQKMETFRGNQAAQQASRDILSADKALALVQDKDPNTLTTQDLRLLSEEMGKIASGGIPGEHGTQALLPNNLQTKYAELKNFVSSSPTDAAAGEYIKRNISYLKEMKSVAAGTLDKYRTNIAKGARKQIGEDNYKDALQAIKDYTFDNSQQKSDTHPQDNEAINWAKSNPSDPRSAAILKANGL